MSQNNYEKFKKLESSHISDAMDRIGIEGALLNLKPLDEGYKICGPAYTVKYKEVSELESVGDFLDEVEESSIIVIDNGGKLDCTVWGDIMSTCAKINGIEGTLINGICRDVKQTREMNYPMYTKGFSMRTGKDRVCLEAVQVDIMIDGIHIFPGDLVFGDDNGVLIIPQNIIETVYDIALEIKEKEEQIKASIENGLSLKSARAKHRYHFLQRNEGTHN